AAKSIVSPGLAPAIALRSEPGPESAVLVTVTAPAFQTRTRRLIATTQARTGLRMAGCTTREVLPCHLDRGPVSSAVKDTVAEPLPQPAYLGFKPHAARSLGMG